MNIKKIAYEKYKLDWMLHHGYTLTDLINGLELMREENEDDSIQQLFVDWEYGFGFGSEIWVCFDEFIDNEYTDTDYMKQILTRDEYQKYQENLNMNSRINAITEFAQRREEEVAIKKKQAEYREEYLKQTILGWTDRIQQLIDTANTCVKYGIRFYHNWTSDRNYDGGHFITDSWCHILGFEFNQHHPSTITRIGKEGGGCCDFDVFTDGKTITATGGSRLWALERFVESFDDFETKFYAYVDRVVRANNFEEEN